jgi:serine/threonine protein kinase
MTQLGHHELLERLGQGAMGVVWRARDTRSGELVALKVLNETSGGRRFRREFRAARRLDHPNVVRVIDMGADALDGVERPWFSMELVEGTTLRELIDRDAQGWPPERNSDEWLGARLSLLHQATLGLEHCHAHGVLHRDLKPTNVLVDSEGVLKLVDFGLARVDEHASSLSGAGQLIGTVAYMSPEQARGGSLDARSDVHGLGAVLFELSCGQAAFRGDDLPSLLMQVLFQPAPDPLAANPGLEPGLAELAARCLSKDPIDRPQSAREVAQALEALAAGKGLVLDGGAARETQGRLRTLRPQLVGRERERQAMRDALEAARERPVALTLVGTSGVGKSRLARELRVDAELQGFRVLSSAAFASSRPLGTLRDALAVATRHAGDEARHDVELLATVLPDLLETEDEDEGPAAPADRLRVTWAAEAVLARMLASGPHLLLLDDLQWADALSAQVIEQLLERNEGALLVVGIFRAGDAEVRPAAERLQAAFTETSAGLRIDLEPLDEDGVTRVVESMLGERPAREVGVELRRATGGLPHDIEQIVRELAARGAFRTENAGLSLSLPAGVELSELSASDATRAQLDKLGPTARRILLAVLLSGRGVHVATLARALDLDEDLLLDELERLVNEGLLRDGPGRDVVSLAHDRLREAFAAGSSADELGSLRTSLARALEGASGAETSLHRVAELDLAASAFDHARRTVPPSAEALAAAGLHAAAVERSRAPSASSLRWKPASGGPTCSCSRDGPSWRCRPTRISWTTLRRTR